MVLVDLGVLVVLVDLRWAGMQITGEMQILAISPVLFFSGEKRIHCKMEKNDFHP